MNEKLKRTLLEIDDFDEFKDALANAFPGKSLIHDIKDEELKAHFVRLAEKINSETIGQHTDPKLLRVPDKEKQHV